MKKLVYIFLAALLALTVIGTDTDTVSIDYTQSVFLGFDDGTLPDGFKPNSGMKMMEGDTSFVNGGIFRSTVTTDPYASYSTNIFYSDYSEIRIRMKHNTPGHPENFIQLFFAGTLSDGTAFSYSPTYTIKQTIGESTPDYVTHVLDLGSVNALTGAVITGIRFDFVGYAGDIYVDYIQLVPENENSDMVYTFDGTYSPWTKNGSIDALSLNGGILSGTTNAHNGVLSDSTHKYLGASYPKVFVRMMFDKETVGEDGKNGVTGTKGSLLYTNLQDADGNVVKSLFGSADSYSYAGLDVLEADNGKYKVYTYDFSKYDIYLNNYITQIAFNPINQQGIRFNIDTILFKNPDSLEWNFECEGLTEGWTVSDSDFVVTGGNLKYTHNSEK